MQPHQYSESQISNVVTPSSVSDAVALLQSFYAAMDVDDRRRRFCGGISNHALAAYCEKLDLSTSFIVCVVEQTGQVRGVLEAHAMDRGFTRADTIICCFGANRPEGIASLLRAAITEAFRRGCTTLVVDVANDPVLLTSLRSLGASSFCDNVVSTDVSGHPLYRSGL